MAGNLVMWEARTVRQVRMIKQNAPGYLNNHVTVQKMISEGKFTGILSTALI